MESSTSIALMTIAITLAAGVVAAILFGFLALRVFRERSKRQYEMEAHRARLSEMRASYEEKISDLMRRMVATPERWVDANHLVLDAQNAQGPSGAAKVDSHRFLAGQARVALC